MLVQLVLIFYGPPQIGFRLEPFTAAFLTFGINSGAYTSEIVRGEFSPSTGGRWRRPAPGDDLSAGHVVHILPRPSADPAS